jgi:hypothetical protein
MGPDLRSVHEVTPPAVEPRSVVDTNGLSHVHVLEESAPARFRSRLLLAVGGVAYVGWHYVHLLLQPDAIDSLGERLGFLGFVAALIAVSFHRTVRGHLVALGYAAVAVGTVHYSSLLARNQLSASYLIGLFVLLGAVSALLVSPRAALTYAVFSVLLAALVAGVSTGAPVEERIELLVGTATVQLGLAISAWRNVFLQHAQRDLVRARHHLRQLRGLLPICMHCNKIRTSADSWEQFEAYVESRTEATFTHSLCHDCADKHYPGI